jgi:Protein of unknown function (DUF4446)
VAVAASITDTQGIIAIAAGALAVVALLASVAVSVSLRRVRTAQRLVLGGREQQDVVAHAAAMQEAFQQLSAYVHETALRLDGRLADVEASLQRALAHHALVRYDAYNELSGQQSMSIALLDDTRSGIVLTCIHHRDQARVYGKQVRDGRGELELSPEEAEAVRLALVGGEASAGNVAERPA